VVNSSIDIEPSGPGEYHIQLRCLWCR